MRRAFALLPGAPERRLAVVMVLAAIVRFVFFTGYHGFDDVFYIRRAYALSHADFVLPTSHWAARIGLVGPTALAYLIFGVNLWSTVLFPFICSLMSVVVAALLGRRLLGEEAGWLAALLVAIFPLDTARRPRSDIIDLPRPRQRQSASTLPIDPLGARNRSPSHRGRRKG